MGDHAQHDHARSPLPPIPIPHHDPLPPTHELHDSTPHHIHEFGDVDRIVHIRRDSEAPVLEENVPVPPVSNKATHARRDRWHRLGNHLFRKRHLMQYFYSQTLFRTPDHRKVSREELFLDLVIVAATATLGHELRVSRIVWPTVEKFILLFYAVYSAWMQVVFLWNLWGVKEDLVEKGGIYVSFMAITGIALGAHNAFDDGVRPYVSVSAFLASFVPLMGNHVFSWSEPLFKNPVNVISQPNLAVTFRLLGPLCYLASAFVGTARATRALYWAAIGSLALAQGLPHLIFQGLHKNIPNHTRLAINIELMVEKFEVLTMIVLGEGIIGLLFEAGAYIGREGARVGLLYLSAVFSTLTLYGLQTYYIQVDSLIARGSVHAIRHNAYAGLGWSFLHMAYHLFLVLFATGLGISVRDVIVAPKYPYPHTAAESRVLGAALLLRAADETAAEGAGASEFDRNARWVFAVGWAGSLVTSALIGAMHKAGPRVATRAPRLFARCALALGLMAGMPFAHVSAGVFQAVFGAVTVVAVLAEFLLVQMDRIGFFRSEQTPLSSTDSGDPTGVTSDFDDWDDDDDDEDEGKGGKVESDLDLESGGGKADGKGVVSGNDCISQALKSRLCKGHDCRMVAVMPKRKGAKKKEGQAGAE